MTPEQQAALEAAYAAAVAYDVSLDTEEELNSENGGYAARYDDKDDDAE